MGFEVFSNEQARPKDAAYITTDKQGRIYLSKESQRVIGVYADTDDFHTVELYCFYDSHNKMIGLGKLGVMNLTGVKPFKFGGKEGRKYASALSFLKYYNILPKTKNRYFYEGKDSNGLHSFKLENYDDPSLDNKYKPDYE